MKHIAIKAFSFNDKPYEQLRIMLEWLNNNKNVESCIAVCKSVAKYHGNDI